ncbi:hypothetical protein [Cellulosilyticum ruminicola]|uniref:hypothetical protein n=1 Tax=Cellulosilyticum ruminicola TaxID=425254 RepID=UPI0006D17EBC|nr:hypothetical protein [Cellulosilyticum ruminicola]
MVTSLSGEMIVADCESDAFLKCYFEDAMNFYVLGQLGGSYGDNMLKFKLKADQTLLLGIKRNLWIINTDKIKTIFDNLRNY